MSSIVPVFLGGALGLLLSGLYGAVLFVLAYRLTKPRLNREGHIPRSPDAVEAPLPTRLRALAGELIRLQPSRRDPERYHVEKDRIAAEIRRAAREVDWTRPAPVRKPSAVPAIARDQRGMQSARR